MTDQIVQLEWCGSRGHHSPTFGEMVPGKVYDVPKALADYFITQRGYWKVPAGRPSAQETEE